MSARPFASDRVALVLTVLMMLAVAVVAWFAGRGYERKYARAPDSTTCEKAARSVCGSKENEREKEICAAHMRKKCEEALSRKAAIP